MFKCPMQYLKAQDTYVRSITLYLRTIKFTKYITSSQVFKPVFRYIIN